MNHVPVDIMLRAFIRAVSVSQSAFISNEMLLTPTADSFMIFHRCAARRTSHNSRKRGRYPLFRYLTRTRRSLKFFYLIPQFAAYNRLVIIRNNDLLFLRNFYDLLIFVRNMLHSLLNQISDVKLLRQYTSDGRG